MYPDYEGYEYHDPRPNGPPAGAILAFFAVVAVIGYIALAAFGVVGAPAAVKNVGSSGGGGGSKYGNAILREAKKYDDQRYSLGAGHPPRKGYMGSVDCSSLVGNAEGRATGVWEEITTETIVNSKHWKKISPSSARAGDVLNLTMASDPHGIGHMVIVAKKLSGDKFLTFAARTSQLPGPDQIAYVTVNYRTYGGVGFNGVYRFHK